ncbi:serine hydrolase domain-containing protein [Nocardia sp. CA-128927]|uniref:serine hydrolase domain-containing protein n=1 Tax=Nocardia sp. CA-128927 TaxID=3239975 RepID=UPI003D99F23A
MDNGTLLALLTDLMREHRVPGAQVVVHYQGQALSAQAGVVVAGTGEPMAGDCAFPVGSITKPFTAALVMALAADGDLDLDDPLGTVVPEVSSTAPVTSRHLLTHTAGLAANIDAAGEQATSLRRWAVRHGVETAVPHPMGRAFSYSSVGFTLAGYLVSQLTGMTWREAVTAVLLEPLGIEPTFVGDVGSASGRSVVGGHTVRSERDRVVYVPPQEGRVVGEPSGGLALSAHDLAVFARHFLVHDRVAGPLDHATTAEMRRDQLADVDIGPYGMADGWGLGWARYQTDSGTDFFGHDGVSDGIAAHLRFDPASGTVVALTANANSGVAMWNGLLERLDVAGLSVGNHPRSAHKAGPPVEAPDACVGRYVNGDMEYVIVRAEDGNLRIQGDGPLAYELTCLADLRFTMRDMSYQGMEYGGRFIRDVETGEIPYLQVIGRLARKV